MAAGLGPTQRQALSLQALSGAEPVTELARRQGVSRRFVYRQAAKAGQALDQAFAPRDHDDQVLFELPVTRSWLRQFVLAQVLIGHTSFRGVRELLEAVFDYQQLSLGSIHQMVAEAVAAAGTLNDRQDLAPIRVGAHDEVFQAGRPVLVGADLDSTYCYLLAAVDQRDETTWGVHLLDLQEQGLNLDYSIADGGTSLRAAQRAAWPGVPCHGDVFHAERELGRLAFYLENRAKGSTTAREKLEAQMRRKTRRRQGRTLSKRLALARRAEVQARRLAQAVRILSDWMRQDILSLAGPDLATRRELFDFVVDELQQCEALCPHRIRPVCRLLVHQRDHLLAFADVLDQRFVDLAARFDVPTHLVHAVCQLQGLDPNHAAHWQRRARLHQQLGAGLHALEQAVREVMAETPRASSIVENLNGRLRNYFYLRRHIGHGYLELLRFFLNHRRFARSERPERVGKTPAELLTGQPHRHWLELLGYQRFQRN
jgi:hypothetical protein